MPSKKIPSEVYERVTNLCLEEHNSYKHKILLVTLVEGCKDDDIAEFSCDPPARVRVMETRKDDIDHWTDSEWCDPYWDVELVEPHPSLDGASGLWVYGISHSISGQIQNTSTWKADENQEPAYQPKAPTQETTSPHPNGDSSFCCPHCGVRIHIDTKKAEE
jgi:hypothetical protein